MIAGTHDINDSSVNNINGVEVRADFIEDTDATGALLNFIYVDEGVINFELSHWMTVNISVVSIGYVPLLNFTPGEYMMYAYDIEENKAIQDGIAFHASRNNFTVTEGNTGNYVKHLHL